MLRKENSIIKRLNIRAYNYCQKYVVSSSKLEEYLINLMRRETQICIDQKKIMEEIESIVTRMNNIGLVNDLEAASVKLRERLRLGYEPNFAVIVSARLAKVDQDLVQGLLAEAILESLYSFGPDRAEEPFDSVSIARIALKRRCRGPFRVGSRSVDTDKRDIGWLQRRGYTFDIIRKAMELSD